MRISTPSRLLILFAVLLLAACGAPATPAPLDQMFTSTDGSLTFSYPSTWTVQEFEGQILLGTSAQALESTTSDTAVTPGQFAVGIIMFKTSDVVGLSPDSGPREVLDVFSQFITGANQTAGQINSPTFGDSADLTIGPRRAARAEGSSGPDQALLIALELEPGAFAILVGGSAPNELARFEPTLRAVADTMSYSASAQRPPQQPPAQPPAQATQEVGS